MRVFCVCTVHLPGSVFHFLDAILGDPLGGPRQKVAVREFRQSDIKAVERRNSESPEKLALGLLLLLLFSTEELSQGNCTKPVRKDILQLDSERLWGIQCKQIPNLLLHLFKTLILQAM